MKKFFTTLSTIAKYFLISASVFTIASVFFIPKTFAQSDEDEDGIYPDRPDLAQEQEIRITKDPVLGYVPRERLLNVFNIINQQRAQRTTQHITPDPLTSATWVERGPSNVGGRTRAIMFDPNDGTYKKVWAGGVGGGLWYTNDITVASPTWINVNDFWANLAISCIAYDPSNTQNFYVGTGEGWYNLDAIQGLGIWNTTDGGATWNQLASTNNSTFYNVQKILVTSNGNIYAATRANGVMRSTDGGTTWTNVLGNSSNSGADLEVGADGTIYASLGIFTTGKIYSSTTGNSGSWTQLNTGSNGFPTSGFQRLEIGVAPSDANTLYVIAQDASTDGLYNIYKSTNKGSAWTALGQPTWCDQGSSSTDMTRTQAWYDLILAVDPNNANTVFAGGVDVMKSTNGGTSWTQATQWTSGCGSMPVMHSDQHAIVFAPGSSSIMMFGNDGGLYYSTNGGSTLSTKNSGYNVTQFYSCAIHPTAGQNYFLAGAQDNGSQKFTSAGMNATTAASGGDGAFCFIDQTNANYQITSYVYNVYYRSTNGGTSFSSLLSDQSHGDFINPADYDDANGILYTSYSTSQLDRISGIRGTPSTTQISISGMTAKAGTIRISPYASSGTTTLFVGTQNGKLYKVTNAQATPTTVSIGSASFPSGGTISCVEIGASENDLLVTFSNYGVVSVWRTTDGGTTWSNAEGNLPDMPVRWAIYNPNNLLEVFLATEVGVWSTTDVSVSSPTWTANSNGLANVRTDMFQLRNSDKELIAATHGRGLFSSDVFFPSAIPPVADFTSSITTVCAGSNVTFTDASTNTPTSWSWAFPGGNPSSSAVQNPVVTYTAAGTYSVSLTATNSAGGNTMNKTNYITVNAIPSPSISVNPSATICSGTGITLTASGGTTYSWSPGNQTTTSITVAPTASTTYSLTASNALGCTNTATKIITVNPIPAAPTAGSNSPVCVGSTLSLTASSSGTTYSWSGPNSFSSTSQNPTIAGVTTAASGTYSVTATASGCTSPKATTSVTVSPLPTPSISVSPSSTICNGTSVILSASGATTYLWSAGQTTSGITVSPTLNTTYTVTGTNASGCSQKATRLITVSSPAISISASPSATICSGSSATLTASGGVSYSWLPGGQTLASISINPTVNTTYTVVGTNAIGCTKTTTKLITISTPTITISASPSSTVCNGTAVTLTASGASNYSWSGGQLTSSITDIILSTSTYSVVGTNALGCTNTATKTITMAAPPIFTVSVSPSSTICSGSSITLTASGAPKYIWSPGGQTTTSVNVSPTTNTTYTVIGSNGCADTITQAITVNPLPITSISVSPSSTICSGSTITLTASGASAYLWTTGQTTNNIIAGPTTNTTYTVTGTNVNGCHKLSTQLVTVSVPNISISASPSATICSGSSLTLTASGGVTYNWFPGGQTTAKITVNPTANTTYTVMGTNVFGCSKTTTKLITVSSPIINVSVNPSATICSGGNVTLTASGASIYNWSPGGQTTTSVVNTVFSNTTYTVMGSNGNGCTNSGTITITVNPTPTISITASPSATICNGGNVTLSASGASTYSWLPGGQTTSGINISPTTNTTYTVSGSNGCATTSTKMITVKPLPAVVINVNPSTTICSGNSDILTASGASTYLWSSGQTTAGISVSPTTNTTYSVTGTGANGCINKTTQAITVSVPVVNVSVSPSSTICGGNSVTLSASGSSTTYSWSPGGQTTANIAVNPTANTTYSVVGTNTTGCSKTTTKLITVSSPVINVSVSPSLTICIGRNATLTASGASTYSWSSGQTTANITVSPTTNTNYSVTGTNGLGCSTTVTKTITVKQMPMVTVSTNPSSTICSGNSITLSATGATTYHWSPGGQTTSAININPTVSSNYTVTGSNGCSTTTTQSITVNALPIVTLTLHPDSVCISAPTYSLTGGSPTGGSYSGAGVNAGNFNPSVAGSGNKTITYSFTDSNGCTKSTTAHIYVNLCTDVESVLDNEQMTIFPNPSSGQFQIIVGNSREYSLEIYNVIGEKVYSEKLLNRKISILNLNLPDGIYILKGIFEKGIVAKKFVINH